MGYPVRIKLTINDLQAQLANQYTTRWHPSPRSCWTILNLNLLQKIDFTSTQMDWLWWVIQYERLAQNFNGHFKVKTYNRSFYFFIHIFFFFLCSGFYKCMNGLKNRLMNKRLAQGLDGHTKAQIHYNWYLYSSNMLILQVCKWTDFGRSEGIDYKRQGLVYLIVSLNFLI